MTTATLITTGEVARRRGVRPQTVRQWVTDGLIAPALITEGGHYRFFDTDFPAPTQEPTEPIEG